MNKPTPFGKTYKEYTEEVEKFELSKIEKVELGSVKELQQQIKGLDSIYSEINKAQEKFVKNIAELDKEAEEQRRINNMGEKSVDKAYEIYNQFEKAAKSLGINPKDSKVYNDLDKTIGSVINIVEKGYGILKGRK